MTNYRILHIEDTWECQHLIRAILTHNGYDVIAADDGEQGVELAKMQSPNLILMDIHLPGIDGLEATRQIRALPSLSCVPIIAVTAADEALDRERALSAGCNAYISKPFSPSHLVSLVRQLCERAPAAQV